MLMTGAVALLSHHGEWDGWGGEWWWIVGRMFFLAVWVLLIVLAVRWFGRGGRRREPSGLERARDVLAERYARGEISTEEYNERLERLR
jgi:putative membrane protein